MEEFRYINVLLLNLKVDDDNIFTYKVNTMDYPKIEVGMRVIVPFGFKNRPEEGYIIELDPPFNYDASKIKKIISIPDRYLFFDNEMLSLAKFISKKYCCTLSESISTFVPQSVRNIKEKEERLTYVKLSDDFNNLSNEEKNNQIERFKGMKSKINQGLILELLNNANVNERISLNEILEKFNITKSTIDTMKKNNFVTVYSDYKNENVEDNFNKEKVTNKVIKELDQTLSPLQMKAYEEIKNSDNDKFLLKGVTGSGKTEIFIKLANDITKEGKNVIILVPEIGLTPQMVKRFEENFENISIMHSKLSASEKLDEWKKVKEHKVNVIIGPRSAIFMPINNIGLIIIDEEHEMTYKSEQTPKYKTWEVAEERARYNGAKIIYSSATPSLETYLRVTLNELKLVELNERYNGKPLPEIKVVDMKDELDKGNKSIFSMPLAMAIKERLERHEQTLLFLNRRGYSTFVSCRKCGHVMKCEHCNIPYVYHANDDSLVCHYCFSKIKNVHICPSCGSKYIKHFGTGTEKVEEAIKEIFPSARVLRMDRDTTARKNSQEEMLESFKNGEYDILVGTQMIAKGHNFPKCTLVGIVTADTMLNFQDFRAPERTYQLIVQVAGRSGRNDEAGEVIMQTYEPDNYAVEAASKYDYEKFVKEELFLRKMMKCPPFSYLFYIVFNHEDEALTKEEITALAKIYKDDLKIENNGIEVLGPGPAIMSKQNDKYRFQLILRGTNEDLVRENALLGLSKYKEVSKNGKNILIQLNFD